MQDLQQLNVLMDAAKAIAGSDYKIAALLEVTPQTVSNWRKGKKPCPAADIALLASVAGLDAQQWLVRATIEKHEGTAKGDKLIRALGKASRAIGGISASAGVAALATCLIHWGDIAHSTMYRLVKLKSQKSMPRRGIFLVCRKQRLTLFRASAV